MKKHIYLITIKRELEYLMNLYIKYNKKPVY